MHRTATIAFNTFREAVRDRVLYNLILFAVLLAGASVLVGQISIEIEHQVVVNLGLTAVSLFGVVIAIFIGIGLVAAFALTRVMSTMLVGVTPTDPLTFAAIAALFIVIAAVASWVPARRAASLDPTVALRDE